MDVVEGIHEEMRVNLIFQILQLTVQILTFQLLDSFLVIHRLEEAFGSNVQSQKQGHDDECH